MRCRTKSSWRTSNHPDDDREEAGETSMERPRLNEGASIDDFVAKLKRVVFPSVFELKFELEL